MTALIAGRYRLESRIGAGAMGQVWRARDERLGRQVAVKTVDLRSVTDPTIAERFRREAIATAQLSHPSIVTIFDSGTDGDTAFLVMELLSGDPVSQVITREGQLPVSTAVHIAGRVADALTAAHAEGIVHRDIKPGNVVVDGSRVTLLDFGIAALISGVAQATLTAPASTIGTAAYMSPEQALGQRPTPASDIYSLGCLLMAMLTGAPPFTGENLIAVAHAQITETPPRVSALRPDIPWELDDLVRRMLSKDAADRPSAQAVVGRLATALNGAPAPTPPPATRVASSDAMGTRVLGAGRGGVASAAREPVTATDNASVGRATAPSWFGKGLKMVAIAVALIFVALAVVAAVPRLTNWAGETFFPSETTSPTPKAEPTKTTKTAKPATSPTKKPLLPKLPTAEQLAPLAAIEAMRLAIDQIVPIDEDGVEARRALLDSWDETSDKLLAGGDADDLEDFVKVLDNQRDQGRITTAEYISLRATLQAVRVLV